MDTYAENIYGLMEKRIISPHETIPNTPWYGNHARVRPFERIRRSSKTLRRIVVVFDDEFDFWFSYY